jgi:hypothetical protein
MDRDRPSHDDAGADLLGALGRSEHCPDHARTVGLDFVQVDRSGQDADACRELEA